MKRCSVAGVVLGWAVLASLAGAADRVVLVEEFTATWCGPCEYAGRAMSRLLDDYPGRLAAFQIHVSDSYATTWGDQRASFYNVTGIPDTWFDGRFEALGASSTQSAYNQYLAILQMRWNNPTPVTLEIGGTSLGGDLYEIAVRVGLEATATAGRDMVLHIVQVLDYYPSGARHRDAFIQAAAPETLHLEPGESVVVTRNLSITGVSAQNIDNVKIIAFAQKPGSPAPRIVYQAVEMDYPFPPLGGGLPGDVDGDGDVDLTDLSLLLTSFGACNGDAAFNPSADFNGDDCVDLSDLSVLLSNFGS